jgi:hypothetical protein
MINPDRFVKLWTEHGESLVRFQQEVVDQLRIPLASKVFLVKAGLPKDAAPFMSFGPGLRGKSLVSVSEEWNLPVHFGSYRMIGSTGTGDPVCVDESANGVIICLNHDREFETVFINSSVAHLAECLLVYREFVSRVIEQNGKEAYSSGNIGGELKAWVASEIRRVDEPALRKACFWENEMSVI